MRFEESTVPLSAQGRADGLTVTGCRSPTPLLSPLPLSFCFLSYSFQPLAGKTASFYSPDPLTFPLFPRVSPEGQTGWWPWAGGDSWREGRRAGCQSATNKFGFALKLELGTQPRHRMCDPPHCPGVLPWLGSHATPWPTGAVGLPTLGLEGLTFIPSCTALACISVFAVLFQRRGHSSQRRGHRCSWPRPVGTVGN